MLLALVLEQLGLAGILLVAQAAAVGLRCHTAHHVRKGRVRLARDAGYTSLDAVAHWQSSAGVVLEDVGLALGRRPINLLAVLAIVVACGPKNGEVQLWHQLQLNVGMPLSHVVHQHATTLEAQHTRVALVDEPLVVRRWNLGHKPLRRKRARSLGTCLLTGLAVWRVQAARVFLELVLALKLPTTKCAEEFAVLRVAEHVQFQLVLPAKHLGTLLAHEALVRVESPNVFAHLVVLGKFFSTSWTSVHAILTMNVDVFFQGSHNMELLFADRALKVSLLFVCLEMFSQSRGVQEALVTRVALQWLCLIVSMYLVMLGQAVFRGKALVAEAALMDSLWHRSPRGGRLIFCFTSRCCL